MLLKNKTNKTQHIYVGERKVIARPYRTVTLDEKVDYNKSIWEEVKVETKKVKE